MTVGKYATIRFYRSIKPSDGQGDLYRFLRSCLRNPSRIAAVAPSSRYLARIMTEEIGATHAPVIELGPGTGVFTRALIERGVDERDLLLLEATPEFVQLLVARFPRANVFQMDAAEVGQIAPAGDKAAGAFVSGLPLLSMPVGKVQSILESAFGCLRPDGAFYQFTYGQKCPVPENVMSALSLKAERIGKTWRNMPPAAVYRISRV